MSKLDRNNFDEMITEASTVFSQFIFLLIGMLYKETSVRA
jgi:hypothetical protein